MPNQNASVAANRAAIPQVLTRGNQHGGEVRVFNSTYVNPATGGPVIGEHIVWGHLPRGARVLRAVLTCSTGTAGSTINLGDPADTTRYSAAVPVAAAGTTTMDPVATMAAGAAGFEVGVINVGGTTDQSELRSVVGGAAIAAGQLFNLTVYYATND